jgi:hypothetical protein
MADFPYGTPVVYEDHRGVEAPLALIAVKEGGAKADLAVMEPNGEWTLLPDVARSAEGGKNTWRPMLAKS